MRYGITGSAGFIGGNLLRKIKQIDKNNSLSIFDPRFDKIPDELDIIYHLGYSSVYNYKVNPIKSLENDINSSKKISSYCQEKNTELVFLSSSSIYEKRKKTSYAKSKIEIEKLLLELFNIKFFPLSIVRLFNPYGLDQNLNFVIPQIFDSLINKKKLKIMEPNSIRDFVFIDDCIDILLLLRNNNSNSPSIFDLGTGAGTSIINLVSLISKIINVEYGEYIRFGLTKNISSIVAKNDMPFDYKFKYTLLEGLKKISNNYKIISYE